MKKTLLITGILVLLALVPLSSVFSAPAFRPIQDAQPTIIPPEVQVPAPTPSDGREVAILNLLIVSDMEGGIEAVELEGARIVTSYAPNVFNKQGPWIIELEGAEPMRYGVPDPRWKIVYPGEEREGLQREFDALTQWELVVPLYYFDFDLEVRVISVYDEFGEMIFSTQVDHEGWR